MTTNGNLADLTLRLVAGAEDAPAIMAPADRLSRMANCVG